MTEIIRVRHLSKQYRASDGSLAVNDVSLVVRQGEILSLLGPNGAGKTTLIALLCGLLRPTAGDAFVAGHSVSRDPMAVKRLVGVVPEELALYTRLTGRQNLRYFGLLYGLRGKALREAIEAALETVGLSERADDRVAHYSNGMKRRLNVAAGVLHEPQIAYLDEPTLGLDPDSRRRILNLVVGLNQNYGTTILYTTHRMDEAQELSQRVGIMHRGRIIALDTPEQLVRSSSVADSVRLHVQPTPVSDSTMGALRRLPDVTQVQAADGSLLVSVHRAADRLTTILEAVRATGLTIDALTVQRPSLESVFLQLTGETLEEASQ